MKLRHLFLSALIFLLGMTGTSYAAENGIIKVSGQGRITLKPDMASVEFRVISKDKNQNKALEENSIRSKQLIEVFRAENIKDEDIETIDLNLRPVMNYENNREELDYYMVTNTIELTIRNIDKLGKFIELASNNGVDSIGYIRYDSSRSNEAYNQALKMAVEDAKSKTNLLGQALGVNIKAVSKLEESSSNHYRPNTVRYDALEESALGAGKAAPEIKLGDLNIEASVIMESIY